MSAEARSPDTERSGRVVDEPSVLYERFAERVEPMSDRQALMEADRCLYCYDAPCMRACPTHIDVPGFIKQIAAGNRLGAARRIMGANVLGASCARVCAVEQLCEGDCVLEKHEKPIEIGRLQRYATDVLIEQDLNPYAQGPDSGRSVGIVGSGPAGLAAAARLRQRGHAVTVYERLPLPGGLATYGIIPLREPREIIEWEVGVVRGLGAEIRSGVEVGRDVAPAELLERHDAVFIAAGAGARCAPIGIDTTGVEGVIDALDWIAEVRTEPLEGVPCGRRVVVIGAGNTGMDACTIAVRLGADDVTCVYRRGEGEMTAYPDEYRHARMDGVSFRFLTQPVGLEQQDGRVSGLRCARVRLGEPDASGRPRPVVDMDDQFTVPADLVVLATGQQREPTIFEAFGLSVDGARPIVDPETLASSNPRVFCGGDSVLEGAKLAVVDASQQGNIAAASIDRLLSTS